MIKGKKILITGAGGFIGAYFLEKLKDSNEVHVILRKKPESYWRLGLFDKKYTVHIADLNEKEKITKIVSAIKPEIVLHFAAHGAYPKLHKDEDTILDTNINGSINILDATLPFAEIIISAGSSSEYGAVPSPMKEDGPTSPTIIYGASKLFVTHYFSIRAKETGKKIIIVRPFSVFGPYEEPLRLVPYLLSSAVTNRKIKLSSPTNVRDYIFVGDFFEGVMYIVKNSDKLKPGEIFNLGTGIETRTEQVVKKINKILGEQLDVEWGKEKIAQPEIPHWFADISKMENFGWKTRYTLEEGLKITLDWIKNNISYYQEK